MGHHIGHTCRAQVEANARHRKEVRHRLRDRAVAVIEFIRHGLQQLVAVGVGNLAIRLETQALVFDVLGGDVCLNRQVNRHGGTLLLALAAEACHGLPHHADVKIEANAFDVTRLFGPKKVSCPPDLKVLHGHRHTGTKVGVGRDCLQALVGGLSEGVVRRIQEVGVRTLAATADASTELVKLAETERVRLLHNQGVCVRDVEPGLDDRRTHKNVVSVLVIVDNHLLELLFAHLAVCDRDARFGYQVSKMERRPIDRLHRVVDVKHLPVAHQFAPDRGRHLRVLLRAHIREDRVAFFRRSRQRRHLTDASDGKLERARDGRCGHRKHIHVGSQRLEGLLVFYSKALFLVDDDESQMLEAHGTCDEPVGPDHHVDLSLGEALDHLARLRVGLETAQRSHFDGKRCKALRERVDMLLDEQRRGTQHRHLSAVLYRLEGRAHGDLCLAKTHVAANEPVHRDGLLHVGLHLVNGAQLVRRLNKSEGLLEFALPWGVGPKLASL